MKYLDETGLARLWEKIKAYVDAHGGDKDAGNTFLQIYGDSSNTRTMSTKDTYYGAFGAGAYGFNSKEGAYTVPPWASINPSSTTGEVTILEKGYYKVDYQIHFNSGFTAGDIATACVLKNYSSSDDGASNIRATRVRVHSATASLNVSGSCIVPCEVNDRLRLAGKNYSNAGGTIYGNGQTRMIITKM